MAIALEETDADPARILETFAKFMEQSGHRVSRAEFERNIHLKLQDKGFTSDMSSLLATGRTWDLEKAVNLVSKEFDRSNSW